MALLLVLLLLPVWLESLPILSVPNVLHLKQHRSNSILDERYAFNLQDLNPVPFSVTFVSTACWNAYGLAAPDYNMFLPNIPGFCAALSTSVTCYALASRKVRLLG